MTNEFDKIKLEILGLSSHNRPDAFALILSECDGQRRKLPIVIGLPEAQAIAVRLENIHSPRPLTHDLFMSLAYAFDINIKEIIIYDLRDGIFFSKLICQRDDTTVEIDSRTSDAVAMSLRFNCPIYTYESIMDKASLLTTSKTTQQQQSTTSHESDINSLNNEQLNDMMNKAIANEDYELASKIRDILQNR